MPRVTTLLESGLISLSDKFCFPEELWWGKGESARPSSSSQTRNVVPFAGRLLRLAWLRGCSQYSLTAAVGSGRLGLLTVAELGQAAASVRCLVFRPSQCCARELVLESVS